jgi:hypothetical protein
MELSLGGQEPDAAGRRELSGQSLTMFAASVTPLDVTRWTDDEFSPLQESGAGATTQE